MRVRIHRGSKEIGGSCVEVESMGQRLLLDVGLPLEDVQGRQFPPLPALDHDSLVAIVISHPHQDHYGLLPWMPKVPVVMGAAARRIIEAAAPFMCQPSCSVAGPVLADRKPMTVGPFSITPFLVDHSAYDAYALLIESEGKSLFYSGDFRMHGRKQGLMALLAEKSPKGVDAMLLEGTTLSRTVQTSAFVSESGLESEFTQCFRETSGLVMVQASAQNIDRLVTVYRACLKAQRTLVIDLYTALVLEATANEKIPQSHWPNIAISIPLRQRVQIKRNAWFEQLQRHSAHRIFLKRDLCRCPEKYVLLFRDLWRRDLDTAGCLAKSAFVHSQWAGYLHGDGFAPIKCWLEAKQIPLKVIHTSGHADPDGLKKLAHAVAPKVLVPIHTTNPKAYNKFGIPVAQYGDGEWWAV